MEVLFVSLDEKTLHIVVKGSVQGVGYRALSKHFADKFGVKGCVKNLSDGSVEIYAQGEISRLDQFVLAVKREKGLAKVECISVDEYKHPKHYKDFEILF